MKTIFSGKESHSLWKEINSLRLKHPAVWEVLYTIGCKLQELEDKIDKKEKGERRSDKNCCNIMDDFRDSIYGTNDIQS